MLAAEYPEADSTLASKTLGCAWAALLSLALFSGRRKRGGARQASSPAVYGRSLLAGAMLFGGPAVSLLIHSRDLDAGSLTIALALTPIVIAIALTALEAKTSDGIAGRIWPGLAAVAGLLLVLAQPELGDARGDLALILAPALTGVGAALFCADADGCTTARAASALAGASVLFAVAGAETYLVAGLRPSASLLAVACDGVLALLGILSLAHLGATRWSSQFMWVPLLIVLEGIVVMRPQLSAHWVIGLALLALSSVYLLLPQGDESNPRTSAVIG